MPIAKLLAMAAREETGNKRDRLTPANDNDPRGPPPAAASRIAPRRALRRLLRRPAFWFGGLHSSRAQGEDAERATAKRIE
ncbi:hypothetical protein [uncultured Rhodoblastus sp.]|uniref:hypothetical protein n=1 Tax=uncultured Rhodoblastus sp. TaxID=543037 RepID=UPI0025D1DC3A|nr:hypothetical protein [uncultured Rhodoblastus sp.]